MGIDIQFLGAVGTVTGSQFLVRAGDSAVLVDCGMFQGSPDEVARNRIPFAFSTDALDAALLTHAHLDHCGRVPQLVRFGFRGPIFATEATVDLAEIVLRDSAKLQVEFAARWQRRHRRVEADAEGEAAAADEDGGPLEGVPERIRQAPPEARAETREPLYDEGDVEQTVRQFRGVRYGQPVAVAEGVEAVFHDAGHILGSAIIELRVRDGETKRTIVFSGDLGRDGSPILRDPTPLTRADDVVVESTYGDRDHPSQEEAVEELARAIDEVSGDKGVLLVPAFAIGRTQDLIWVLDELVRQGRIPRLPLFLDSPMASRATDVYLRHPETYDEETAQLLRSGDSPLEYPGQDFTNSVEESKAIRRKQRPFMVVASSGMLTGGRIVHHLKDFLPDPACTLLFIGYQGEGTLGRHIQEGARTARIDGEEYPVRCRVRSISGFSAHADEDELTAWLARFAADGGRPRVFPVHGDPAVVDSFATRIRDELGLDVHVPRYLERLSLDG